MEHIVSFSGGRTSAYLVHLMELKKKEKGWNVKYVFLDTGGEHHKTHKFIKKIVAHYKIDLVCLRAVVNQEHGKGCDYQVVDIDDCKFDMSLMKQLNKKYGAFTIGRPYCTDRMKSTIFDKYKKDTCPNAYTWLGIRIDEPKRLKFMEIQTDAFESNAKDNKRNLRYLAEISDFEKQDILDFWSAMPFDLEIDEWLGNCVFCIKKSNLKLALAQREEPEMFKEWCNMVNDQDVRIMPTDKHGKGHIYRNWLTPEMVIAQFDGIETSDLKKRVLGAKMDDTGSCSESCEVFSDQMDMFEDGDL